LTQIADHGDRAAIHPEPLFLLVAGNPCVAWLAVVQAGLAAAQPNQVAMPREHFGVLTLRELVPIQL
jgi:hypothetical protein